MTPGPIRILFLSANPRSDLTDLDTEFRRVSEEIQNDDRFKLISRDDVTAAKLQDAIRDEKPHILHFSGHGMDKQGDLVLQKDRGGGQPLPLDTLANVLKTLRDVIPLRIVVLNACWTLENADALRNVVDAVVGMTHEIDSESAVNFAQAFYGALNSGLSLPEAVAYGKDRIDLKRLPDSAIPDFRARHGIDAAQIRMVENALFIPEPPLEWGSEGQADLSNPDAPLDEAIIKGLLSLYPHEKGRITDHEPINQGLSGASVYVVSIRINDLETQSAVVKIDAHPRVVRECQIHKQVKRSAISRYVPALLCEPLGPIHGWSAAVYQMAADTRLFARSLEGLIADTNLGIRPKRETLQALMETALQPWHQELKRLEDDTRNEVPVLIEGMLNLGGKDRLGDALRDRLRQHGLGGEGNPTLRFTDCGQMLHNPMAYILNPHLWMKDGKPITIDAPRTAIHGDLHGGNLICELNADGKPLGKAPWIIDFALSSHLGVPFYDLAYLEIDILLRRMPCDRNRIEDWNAWLTMTEFLASSVYPSDVQADHLNEHLSNLWALLKPIRTQADRLIRQGSNRDTQAQFEWAFWLAMMAAGVMVTRRSRMEPPEKHKAALLYAARALEKLRNLLALPFQNATPFPIEWLSTPRAPEPEAVKAYLEGAGRTIIESFRSEFEGLESWAIPLEGEQTARPSQPSAAVDDLDAGMREMMGLLGKTEGTHLPAGQADEELDKALQHADPVPDVPDHLMELKRAVLIGVPGAGKTVTLEQLMIRHAQTCQKDPQHPIPVLVPLARFDGKQSFTDYARSYLINLREHAPELPLVWLLDALNEMPVEGVKTGEKKARSLVEEVVSFLKEELQTGAERGLDRRFVLSCRVADYRDELRSIPDVDKIALKPLAPTKIQRVIQRRLSKHPALAADLWRAMGGSDALLRAYAAFEKAGEADEFWEGKPGSVPDATSWAHVQDPRLLQELKELEANGETLYWGDFPDPFVEDMSARKAMLEDERGLLRISRNPFDLTLLILLAISDGVANLPSDRAELLIKQAQARLNHEYAEAKRRKDPTWTDATIPRIQKVLGLVAQAMQRTEQRTEIGLEHALTAAAEPDALDLLRKAARAALIDLRDSIRFQHQLWQEYFAALRLLEAMKAEEDPAQHFSLNWWDASAWRESLKFLVQVSGDRTQVIHWIAPYAPEAALALWEAERPAAEGLAGVQQDAAGKRDPLLERIRQAAEARCEYDFERQAWRDLNPDPRGRAAAFRVLGHPAIDADPRPGVGTYVRADGVKLPDIVWADAVQPGIYPLGHEIESDNPPRQFELKYSYQLARYPITYAQFQTFLDDKEGFSDARWWAGLGDDEYRRENQSNPDDQAFKVLNHPRERVSWYDAMAFCRWLSWRLGGRWELDRIAEWAVRLPTEQEWEIAARAQTGWLYPWGSAYQEGYANINETYQNAGPYYLRQSSAVGLYPQGDARHWTQSISDLSGNVWEWCLTEYRNSPDDMAPENLSSDFRRVLRGGSWLSFQDDARAVFRDFNLPLNRNRDIGFRVCRPPSR